MTRDYFIPLGTVLALVLSNSFCQLFDNRLVMPKGVPIKIADIGHINPKTRLEGDHLVREFGCVVHLFNRVLQFKERERLILDSKIQDLEKRIEDNLSKLKVLNINLNIYDQNDERISSAMTELEHQEQTVKKKYETMLAGKIPTDDMVGLDPKKLSLQKQVTFEVESKLMEQYSERISGRDGLIQRRRRYLEDLDNTFKRFDEELFYIDGVRNNLLNARSEIAHKKDKAMNSKASLEANNEDLQEEKTNFEAGLEHSIEEESYLLCEFRELIAPISKHLEIRPQTDQLLMHLNSAAETSTELTVPSQNETGKGRLKVLESPVRATSA